MAAVGWARRVVGLILAATLSFSLGTATHQHSEMAAEACMTDQTEVRQIVVGAGGGGNVPLASGAFLLCAKSWARVPPITVINDPPCEFDEFGDGRWHCPYDIIEGTGGRGEHPGRSRQDCGGNEPEEEVTCHYDEMITEWAVGTQAYVNEVNWKENFVSGHLHAVGEICVLFLTHANAQFVSLSITSDPVDAYCTAIHT